MVLMAFRGMRAMNCLLRSRGGGVLRVCVGGRVGGSVSVRLFISGCMSSSAVDGNANGTGNRRIYWQEMQIAIA